MSIPASLEGKDKDIVLYLLRHGLLTEEQVHDASIARDEQTSQGVPPPLVDILVELKYLPGGEALDALRSKSRATGICDDCGRAYNVYFFNDRARYSCPECRKRLRIDPDASPPPETAMEVLRETQTIDTRRTTTRKRVRRPKPAVPRDERLIQTVEGGTTGRPSDETTLTETRHDAPIPPEVVEARKKSRNVFGKYVLVEELGRGGAGIVHKAWDLTLHKYVALKFLRDEDPGGEGSSTGEQIEAFQREARMSAKLRHPNIVHIFELGCMSNRHYLSMEYIEGTSLMELLHGGKERNQSTTFPQNPKKLLGILRKVALAVQYAHEQNPPVIHRDLKPHNVLIDHHGEPYVVDFGLAKEVSVSSSRTATGIVKGTPAYMAPEQAEGLSKDIDARTDVYSMGAILYEMLAGRPPFVGDRVRGVLNKIVMEIPRRPNEVLAELRTKQGETQGSSRGVPRPLETISLKALEKLRQDRYPTAKAFADDIGRFLQDEDILAVEPGLWRRVRRKLRAHPVLSGTAAALIVGATAAFALARSLPERDRMVERVVERAETILEAKNWSAMDGALEDLARYAPKHDLVKRIRTAVVERETRHDAARDEWNRTLARLESEPVATVADALRPLMRAHPDLAGEFLAGWEAALAPLPSRIFVEARTLVGDGEPRPSWVEEIVKQAAQRNRDQIRGLVALREDPDLPFVTDAPLADFLDPLDRILAYQGTWTLKINVLPFAEVALLKDGKPLATDWTPVGIRELEVGKSSYSVELFWPSREQPQVRIERDVSELRHGETVVISGEIASSNIRMERQ